MNGYSELLYIVEGCAQRNITDLGKKKFQKLVYLIENIGEVPLGYGYQIYFYGPYSRELDDDLLELVRDEKVFIHREGQSHLIHLTQRGFDLAAMRKPERFISIDSQLDSFGHKTPLELELLTTTHYVATALGKPTDVGCVKRNVKKVKGTKFSDASIEAAILELNLAM